MKKTSARNAFTGTINRIKRGDLLVEVEILTSTGLQVVSIITAESADNLELREGINTTATIKAPWVIISTGDAPTSARNHFSGKVQSVQLGEIEAEVLVTLDEGTTVCAVITSQSARVLKLEPGKPVSVLFKAFGKAFCYRGKPEAGQHEGSGKAAAFLRFCPRCRVSSGYTSTSGARSERASGSLARRAG